ncbi:TIGR01777 family oxidoreductase [Mammaliicoccus lentus]|uniref:TIGR01777 family oxidoreductase n=1 Tax=Mammaliicoccus lentus TaxID=42858 RepID=UPI000CD008F1|nr:TIGR01777 family oxidoreductase [Mammaliicoccus lentus]HBV04462.1 TIGR01777 family protein [Staphylococcus sp.]MDQ7143227.1 TIGR01777 family oxidoreductase [Mammaliicoccus lentus]POA07678.1 TIGR01777 family protein [Mammaliicoccus lentus]WHI54741.1 TIGR01777 family oxidoreductase [Mammaliicoccus lentus]WHI57264.1 TIGR01777 family oxidoreductase [Mammaliicoccus lentus]
MKRILITGGTGLVGSELVDYYLANNDEVYVLTRSDRDSNNTSLYYINWSKENWEKAIPKIDVVINLAGASLMNRWTEDSKETIMNSRIESTNRLFKFFEAQDYAPEVLFNASAVGYYPPSKVVSYDEYDQFLSHDFLSTVVERWEETALLFKELGTRVVIGRFGIILSNKGGALTTMVKPYKFFVGGSLGSGEQWMSWIHLEDLKEAITTLINNKDKQGVYNICSPNPVRQKVLGKTIAQTINRPHFLPGPKFALRAVLGEQSTMILDVQRVFPKKLLEMRFPFKYPEIDEAIKDLLN